MDKIKERLAIIAPYVFVYCLGLATYYMGENSERCFDLLIAIIGAF